MKEREVNVFALRSSKIYALLERWKLYRVNEKVKKRGESVGRSMYNEMELHRTNATAKAHRLGHQWRNVIGYSLCAAKHKLCYGQLNIM